MVNKYLCIASILLLFVSKSYSQLYQLLLIDHSLADSSNGPYGNGLSLFDWNKDGFDDLVLLKNGSQPRFFQNLEGVFFEIIIPSIQITGDPISVCWVDYDNDSHMDIAFNILNGSYSLFHNNGDFTFTNVSATCGFDQHTAKGYGQSWGDYNRDGFLDVYICNYNSSLVGYQPNRLYRNNQNGTFTDVTINSGVSIGMASLPTFQSAWVDYNRDALSDLLIINDHSDFENYLFSYDGIGAFADVSAQTNMNGAFDPMSISVADYNNNGTLDVFMSNVPLYGNYLYQNDGQGAFQNVAGESGLIMLQQTWGAIWTDADNDMLQDLFIGTQEPMNNLYFFRNVDGVNFIVDFSSGLQSSNTMSFASAKGDINNDGFEDLVTHNKQGEGTQIWQNQGNGGNFLRIRLEGTISNKDAVGSFIDLYAGNVHQTRFLLCGEQYISQNSQWQNFGLSTLQVVDSIIITWPSNLIDRYYDVPVNQILEYIEGNSISNSITEVAGSSHCSGGVVTLDAGIWDSYLWSNGFTGRFLTLNSPGIFSVTTTAGAVTVNSTQYSIEFFEPANLAFLASSPACFGDANAFISLVADSELITNNQVVWNTGQTGLLLNNMPAGIFTYIYTDDHGCQYSDSITIQQPDSLSISAEVNLSDNEAACPYTWNGDMQMQGGTSPLVSFWEFYHTGDDDPYDVIYGPSFSCISSLEPLEIIGYVQDGNNCSSSKYFQLSVINGLHSNAEMSGLSLFPNPVSDVVAISGNTADAVMCLFDMQGRLLKHEIFIAAPKQIFSMQDFVPGIYLLRVQMKNHNATYRLVKN